MKKSLPVWSKNNPFKDGDEYHAFAVKHNTFGAEAHKLKRKLDKQTQIPEPKLSISRKHKYA